MSTNQSRVPAPSTPTSPSSGDAGSIPSGRCQGIIPPYLLEVVARSDHPEAVRAATRSLTVDLHQRERRQDQRVGMLAPDSGPTPAPGPGQIVGPHRSVSDCGGRVVLPGEQVRAEGGPPAGDVGADEAYDGLGHTWSLLHEVYGRDSLDGSGLPLAGSVHYGDHYDNAFWNGEQMVFGDGDGVVFNRFTASVDVIGHELTHGLTQCCGGLEYRGQSGALNEHLSDVMGSLVKQRTLGHDAASADWLIGAGLFTAAVKGVALRSMRAPGTAYDDPAIGKDPQPGTMAGYVQTSADNGGVHINSGIPNHAFYLLATALGGPAWVVAGQIWFDVLTGGRLQRGADFAAFAALTEAAAGDRYGAGSSPARAVADAWRQVGVVGAVAPGGPVVQLERSGGFAGRTVTRDVDLSALPPEDASSWHDLLGSRLLADLPDESPQPDRYVYRVSCDPAGVQACAAEQQLPGHVVTLFEKALRSQ